MASAAPEDPRETPEQRPWRLEAHSLAFKLRQTAAEFRIPAKPFRFGIAREDEALPRKVSQRVFRVEMGVLH